MDSTNPTGSLQPRGTKNATDATNVPTSRVVKRGAAPKATFQIPDNGLHVKEEQSFLSRFHKNRLNLYKTVGIEPSSRNQSSNISSQPQESIQQNHSQMQLKVKSIVNEKKPDNKSSQIQLDSTHDNDDAQIKMRQKQAEEVADAVEDNLINIRSDEASLLSEQRSSFPILRFCAAKGVLNQQALEHLGVPLGFMWAPFGNMAKVPEISRAPNRCGTCSSFFAIGNGAESVESGKTVWKCSFCGRDDNQLSVSVAPSAETLPETSNEAVEYLNLKQTSRGGIGKGAMVVITDENLEPHQAEWVREAVAIVHASAARRGNRFILITVGGGCSVAVQSNDNSASMPTMEMMTAERASKLTRDEKEKYFLNAPKTIDHGKELDSEVTNRFIRGRAPNPIVQITKNSDEQNGNDENLQQAEVKSRLDPYMESRRLDIALVVACELLSNTVDTDNTRILSILTGSPTCAMQSPEHTIMQTNGKLTSTIEQNIRTEYESKLLSVYEHAGSRAGDLRIAIDFICFGSKEGFAGPVLLAAAKRSRGGLLYTGTHGFSSASALAEAASYFAERSSKPGVVSVRVSSPLTVARVIGPAFPTAAPHTYAIPGIDPSVGFTVVLKGNSGSEHNIDESTHATLQLAAKSMNRTRVITIKVPLTRNIEEYITDIDAEISALVLGKACVVSGGALTQPDIASKAVDTAVGRLLRGSEKSASIARILYELRRGLLLDGKVHPDCALVLRSFFLRSEASLASLLMSPRLFTNAMSDENTGLMAEVPLEKSYVKDDAVLVLDTGFSMFVYVGENASTEAEEAISESARTVAAQRVSPCQLWKLRPGRDADYLLDTYLAQPKRSSSIPPVHQGFLPYCMSIAPDAESVKMLRRARA